jgi:hypothetical protein
MKFVAIVLLGLVASACAQAPAAGPAAALTVSATRTADNDAGVTEVYEPTRYTQQTPAQVGEGTTWEFMSEPAQRLAVNYSGFVFDFNTARPAAVDDTSPTNNITTNQISQNAFLSTLPAPTNGQTLVRFGACGGNTIHSHPRGSEISTMLYGTVDFGFVEENGGGVRLYITTVHAGMTVHVPQGLLHFSHNQECTPAGFLANFAYRDPGTQSTIPALFRIPIPILHMSSGIPEATWLNLRTQYPPPQAPGTGGEDCLRRCNLGSFASNNLVIPVTDVFATLAVPAPAPASG